MNIIIQNKAIRKKVTINASKAGVVTVIAKPRKQIKLQLFKDGLSAYEIAVRNGYTGTETEYAAEAIHPIIDFTAHYILSKT